MFARKLLTGLVTGSIAASVIGLTATGASAATDPDDSPGTPIASDLVGVGSDTSQGVLRAAADAYNQTSSSNGRKLFTYAATGGGNITLPNGTSIARPVGSGAGKALLYGSGNNTQIDFARSSSGQSNDENTAGLKSYPFALDTLKTVVSPNSNAPASISRADLLRIYEGTATTWNQVGGTSTAKIQPLLPQSGSGTRTFFINQLTAEKGSAFNDSTSPATPFQENDDSLIKNNPNAIAPFSEGRASLLGGTVRVEGGFAAQRALYNVVRPGDVGTAPVLAAFGPSGFLCSSAATALIEESGFRQLATAANGGGSCGEAVNSTSTFVLNERANTTTTLAATSPAASQARLVATVTSSSAPQGTVTFSEGGTVIASGVQLVSGQATRTIPASPGAHTYTATFVPAGGSLFRRSSANAGVNVSGAAVAAPAKFGSSLSESFPAKAKVKVKTVKGKKKTTVKPVSGSVTVNVTGAAGSGTVLVKRGGATVGSGSVVNGVATFALTGLKKGNNALTATYGGSATVNASTLTFSVNAKAPKAKGKK